MPTEGCFVLYSAIKIVLSHFKLKIYQTKYYFEEYVIFFP